MTNIVLFPRGQLTVKDARRLEKHGIVAVEVDDPSKVIVTMPSSSLLSPDDLMMSAMHGMSGDYSTAEHSKFFSELHRRLKAAETKRAQPAPESDA